MVVEFLIWVIGFKFILIPFYKYATLDTLQIYSIVIEPNDNGGGSFWKKIFILFRLMMFTETRKKLLIFLMQRVVFKLTVCKTESLLKIILSKKCNISYPVVVDVEWAGGAEGNNGRADYLTNEERTNAINGFCDTIRNAGYVPMVYANKYWLTDHIDVENLRADIWLAHYVKGAPENLSDYQGEYQMWQYTSTGKVNGISGDVDMNICYKKY